MHLFVLADVDGDDLIFRLVDSRVGGYGITGMRRLRGQAAHIADDPCTVYGDAAAEWTEQSKSDLTFTVFRPSWGRLV